jgi:hypothetical protein
MGSPLKKNLPTRGKGLDDTQNFVILASVFLDDPDIERGRQAGEQIRIELLLVFKVAV